MKLLLVEDDVTTAEHISRSLREHGHVVDHAATGRDGLFLATDASYDVVIVDRMLPGIETCTGEKYPQRRCQNTRAVSYHARWHR